MRNFEVSDENFVLIKFSPVSWKKMGAEVLVQRKNLPLAIDSNYEWNEFWKALDSYIVS
jgi:hypothetical protein